MKNNYFVTMLRSLLAILVCIFSTNLLAVTEVHVEKAGTLPSLLTSTDSELKVTGVINGTDIKFIRELVTAGTVTRLDWSGVKIVAGGEAYFESFKTEDNVIGEKMFTECSNLQSIVLPSTLSSILSNAFSRTGLKQVDIPNSVTRIGSDAFAYCNSLQKVIVGKRVTHLGQGVFFSSAVRYAYVKPITPPAPPVYLFSSNPSITVYSTALADYRDSGWKDYGTIRGGLENTYPMEPDPYDAMKALCGNFFEDAACTQLKAEYQAMSDEQLTTALTEAGMSELLIATALKIKNQDWAAYEQDFRIHNYKAYSDANYWNEKMMSNGGSYMGNPTGIYAQNDGDEIYVFVDCDVPADATLYFAGCVENDLITSAKSGQKLTKGLNVIDGTKDAIYYVLYTADTKSQTKTLSEWPEIKIHIAGGKVNGYYDVSRHSDADYQAILKAATLPRFTVRGGHSLYHLKTSSYKSVFPRSIDKSIIWFDSVAVWQKELMGMCESVASGKKAGAPWFLTGGEAIYPLYYNNPNFAIEGEETDAGYANASTYRTAYNSLTCIRNCLDATNPEMDDWCAGHECGHNNQRAINLEGCGESSNNLFSNYVRYLDGLVTSNGSPLSTVMGEFARREPFYTRNVDSKLRMYWNLYLYYHLGQKNTSFYPELFKALRKDPMTLWNASNNNNSGLKFVRKVCEIAQEDLTDFFTVWGFFEPMNRQTIEDYGTYTMTVTKSNINSTKYNISKYPVKNREILFVEDRADYVLTNGFLTTAGKKRRGSEVVGQCGDLGQFTDYWPGACAPSEYVYMYADSLYAMEGKGGLGFLMLDADDNLKYAANAKNFCIPSSVGRDFKIYSYDADGSLHEVAKGGNGIERVENNTAGRLNKGLTEFAIKAIVSGKINGTDVKHLRSLLTDGNLQSIDLSQATVSGGGTPYYTSGTTSYNTSTNNLGDYAFHTFKKLSSIQLPQGLVKIGSNAFSRSGLQMIEIPDKVVSVSGDAFAYCDQLTTVIVGKAVRSMAQGIFYNSPVKHAYVKALTPPNVSTYLFSSNPVIHVYASAVETYKASKWAEYGTIVGDLDDDFIDAIETVQAEAEGGFGEPVATYDLMGRMVSETTPGSLYIRNGKKFVAGR